jgi:hypothetical protein
MQDTRHTIKTSNPLIMGVEEIKTKGIDNMLNRIIAEKRLSLDKESSRFRKLTNINHQYQKRKKAPDTS